MVFEKFTSADLSQITREKSCDYLLIIHIQKFYTASTSLVDVKLLNTCSVAYLSDSLLKHCGVAGPAL